MCPKACSEKRTIIKHLRRRHGFKGTEPNIEEFYSRLDPRECNLGLDEPTMASIFGPPPKKPRDEVLIADYVTVANIQPVGEGNEESQSTEDTQDSLILKSQTDDGESTEGDKENNSVSTEKQIEIKIEATEPFEGSGELEPADIVSVKIEPLDDEHAGQES